MHVQSEKIEDDDAFEGIQGGSCAFTRNKKMN